MMLVRVNQNSKVANQNSELKDAIGSVELRRTAASGDDCLWIHHYNEPLSRTCHLFHCYYYKNTNYRFVKLKNTNNLPMITFKM